MGLRYATAIIAVANIPLVATALSWLDEREASTPVLGKQELFAGSQSRYCSDAHDMKASF